MRAHNRTTTRLVVAALLAVLSSGPLAAAADDAHTVRPGATLVSQTFDVPADGVSRIQRRMSKLRVSGSMLLAAATATAVRDHVADDGIAFLMAYSRRSWPWSPERFWDEGLPTTWWIASPCWSGSPWCSSPLDGASRADST